ncbi:A/G-specific adenine glycosylase [Danxiaibacter flavus]|uniref:Adenine DNA glycosylase n=1 Tax=Danxiaibacter flavus TaxID=3049108 RepID=A0ABV3ZKU1_9BACT|nr:A/G-specific adenine glycosylase [Chitinophagaceae bacterium DXS]
MDKSKFSAILLHWHQHENTRVMPWKGIKDPYKIWLSEVILQQTRVDQGWKYYESFIEKYPDILHLANAEDKEVFKLWEGLGYYNRCKNLLHTARFIAENNNGKFPADYDEILALKGVGPYTAAAIASFAFRLPYAVVDGNVFRVLARVFGNSTPVDATEGKALFTSLAQELLDKKNPGLYNQAIMDFGATVCKPALPLCSNCVLQKQCTAFNTGTVNHLPVKEKVLKKKTRWFSFFVFRHNNKTLISKRTGNDIWQNLHEFYLVETDEKPVWSTETVLDVLSSQLNIKKAEVKDISPLISQQLTHQTIKAVFVRVILPEIPASLKKLDWLKDAEIEKLAFPRIINQYLSQP